MFRKIIFSLVVLAASIQLVFALTGKEIMEKSEKLISAKTARSTIHMTIYKGDEILNREMKVMGLKMGGSEKALIEFLTPVNMKILTFSEGGDDQQWLKQKDMKVKKIVSGDRNKAVVNSHFFYEDLKPRNINDSTYTLAGSAMVESFDCHKIEASPKPGKSVYDRAIFYVRKSDNFIIQTDIYYKGFLYKRLINYNIEKINGVLTPRKSVMYRLEKDGSNLGKTVLEIKEVVYNDPGITERDFNKSRL